VTVPVTPLRSAACVDPVRVASVPEGHVYVRHLSVPGDGVVRLPDPPVPGAPDGQWWPPVMLDPEWVRGNADAFDVFHLHFGFDDRSPQQLGALVAALRAAGRPLVLTVHDLRNPHHADPAAHAAALDVLVPSADALLTLTPGAAAEIAARWGRGAVVVPHPHVVEADRAARPRPGHDGFVVGVHAKADRANSDAPAVVRALAPVVAAIPGGRVEVVVRDDGPGRELASGLRDLPAVDVRPGPRLTDDQLWDHLSGLDLSVLPYRFGTHSGWLEACHDLGTAVLAPDCGFYDQQAPCLIYHRGPSGPDAASLAAGVHEAHRRGAGPRTTVEERAAQRCAVAAAHAAIYREVLG